KKPQSSRMASQLAFMMIEYIRRAGVGARGAKRAEVGWILEDNQGMVAIADALGSKVNREHRIYSEHLEGVAYDGQGNLHAGVPVGQGGVGPPGIKMRGAKPIKQTTAPLGRVLVVEDDPVQGMALEAALSDAGATSVVICPSIACTMTALEEGPADAIVLDVHLADRDDGWALAELVDVLGPKRPRIVFSTASPEDIPPEVAEMGPVFAKPYDPAQLAEVLASGAKRGLFQRLRNAIG